MSKSARSLGALSLCAALLLAACGAPTAAPTDEPEATPAPQARAATLDEIVNVVQVRLPPQDSFEMAVTGSLVEAGGQIQTGDSSSARLDFMQGTIVRLASNTLFTVQSIQPSAGGLLTRLGLEAGKIWASLLGGGSLEVESPMGVASIRGSFGSFEYNPGDPDDPGDDILIVDCLEGACMAMSADGHHELGNLERLVLTGEGRVTRFQLTGVAVDEFLKHNPDGQAIILTLTAAAPEASPTTPPSRTPTKTARPPRPSQTAAATSTSTATRTKAPPPRATSTDTPAPTASPSHTPTASATHDQAGTHQPPPASSTPAPYVAPPSDTPPPAPSDTSPPPSDTPAPADTPPPTDTPAPYP